ncbi:odorant receptor 30a [Drosophila sulfurigaster albostrigata]|uniref:odorant receptor 30a n=1 Tax=Drosophila sulfurigaster albostrigata TaxID=89887 RepID=UPI002D21AC40|nr:odorant receptor 30a [Drosophila sulfurigaster albostrigata]
MELQAMATTEMPIFGNTLKLMKFWSYLYVHNWRRYVAMTPYVLTNVTQYFDIYLSTEPLDFIIRNVYLAVLFTNTIVRGVLLILHRKQYEGFLELLKSYYLQLLKSTDKHIAQLVLETTRLSNSIGRINLLMGTCSCIGFVTYPIFGTERVLPYGMYVPGIDKYASPYYEFFFVVQAIMAPMGCCMYIPYTNLVVTFTLFAILMCRVLQHKLRSLQRLPVSRVRQEIIWCIQYQVKLEGFVNAMNQLNTNLHLVEFLCFGAMLCVLLFSMIIAQTIAQTVIVIAYMIMIFANSSVLYYVANELYFQSFYVSIAAYESNWMDFDVETQKTLKFLIMRSQKPLAILVGGVYPMNLKMLQSLLNVIYSFFTLLRRVYG